jgi:hypothetical protein
MTDTRATPFTVGPRGEVHTYTPWQEGHGTSRSWRRTINGARFTFTVVNMPDGEVRWFVDRFNGYCGGEGWACAWNRVRSWTLRLQVAPAPTVAQWRELADAMHAKAVRVGIRADVSRIANALGVLGDALDVADLTTARYAAATITERSDQVEAALLALEVDAKAVRPGPVPA